MVPSVLRTYPELLKLATILCVFISISFLSFTSKKTDFIQRARIGNTHLSSGVTGPLFADDGVSEIVPPPIDNDVRIVHIISPYVVDTCDAPFCPVDQEQSLVMGSMLRAAEKSRRPVLLAAATLPEDAAAAPPDFIRLSLTRSAATEYTNTKYNTTKELPFIQDIFDGLRNSDIQYDYVIYTNADIILHEDFYNIVRKQIWAGYDFFQINRQTVIGGNINSKGDPYTVQDLDEIFASQELQLHEGTDCFVIRRNIFEKVDMGNLFLGTPPFANMLQLQTSYYATKARRFGSLQLKAIYHLGRYATHHLNVWSKSAPLLRLMKQNINNAVAVFFPVWKKRCAIKRGSTAIDWRIGEYCNGMTLELEKKLVGNGTKTGKVR